MKLFRRQRHGRGSHGLLFVLIVGVLRTAGGAPDAGAPPDVAYASVLDQLHNADVRSAYVAYTQAGEQDPAGDAKAQVAYALLEAYHKNPDSAHLTSAELSVLLRDCQGGKVPSIILERANALFDRKDYGAARLYYERIITSYQADDAAALVYFRRAECFYFKKEWMDAESAYGTFVQNFPNDERLAVAKLRRADCKTKSAVVSGQ